MAEAGRGRGLAMFQSLLKKQQQGGSDGGGDSTPAAPVAPTPVSPPSSVPSEVAIGGRGRAALMMLKPQRPGGMQPSSDRGSGGDAPSPSPAPSAVGSDVPVAAAPPRGMGRGLAVLAQLKRPTPTASPGPSTAPSKVSVADDVYSVTSKMAGTVISDTSAVTTSTLKPKNKYTRQVKETPPVINKGETGSPVDLTANYIRLSVEPGKGVFEYEVRYEPQQDHRGHRIKILNMFLDVIGRTKTFDGTTLYLPFELPQEVTELTGKHPAEDHNVCVKIIYRRQRRMGEVVHLYNVLFKNIMRELKLIRFGRQDYDPAGAIMIPQHKLEVWPGYVTAVDEYEGGLMLTLDSTHRVLRKETVLQFIREVVNRDRMHWKENVAQALYGCSVMTTYNNMLYRVDDMDATKNPLSTFTQRDGTEISYYDYYKQHYDVEIVDLEQPLLLSRKKRVLMGKNGQTEKEDVLVSLVPELCRMTGLTDDQRTNFRLMKDVATYTRITPNQRLYAFKTFLKSVENNEVCKKLLSNWGLKIAPDTVSLRGRLLPPESITFGNGKVVAGQRNAEWNRDATNSNVIEAKDIYNWVLIYTRKDQSCSQDFVDTLKRCGPPMGIKVNPPKMIMLQSDSNTTYSQTLESCITESVQLVVVVCPSARDDRYAVIKKICNVRRPVPSQVINARTIMNRDKVRAIVQKIALQINCKLGGTLWSVAMPFSSAMVVGIDSYHEVGRRDHSFCGFVASYNRACTHWYSRVVCQQPGQEIVDGLQQCLTDAIKHFRSVNGEFPQRLIIYRDGVSDGQFDEVQNYEIPQMRKSFESVEAGYAPALTFLVVQKRINTRLFKRLNGAETENPMPGTVCDYDIMRRDWYDFLLVPQRVGQGTVTPCHYVVLHNTSTMTPDQVQRLTYKLCHLYYNWPGTVRVPAPCQYAHKLAFLVGKSMKQHHHPSLSDKLFFL